MRGTILHDIKHKAFKLKHDNKERDIDTTADRDAARMSRYKIAKEDLTGEYLSLSHVFERDMSDRIRRKYSIYCQDNYIDSNETDAQLYMKLLDDRIVGNFNEITSMPYTSLKYHTLLVCALHYNYKQGRDFQDLFLHCKTEQPKELYTTIFKCDEIWFVINNDSSGAKIGAPTPFFGQTIGRLYDIPLREFLVDNLRRFRSWSAGLQYLEDALIFIREQGVM